MLAAVLLDFQLVSVRHFAQREPLPWADTQASFWNSSPAAELESTQEELLEAVEQMSVGHELSHTKLSQ